MKLNRPVGCGLWVVGLLIALFAAEWLALWIVMQTIPVERLPAAVLSVSAATILVGSLAVYFRVQRRAR